MELSSSQYNLVKNLDDGSLYAHPEIIREQFRYHDMMSPRLLVNRDPLGFPNGYLPVGQFYIDGTLSYIAAMPNSPAISPTYPPGAGYLLRRIDFPYLDTDVITELDCCRQVPTASAYGLPLSNYLQKLSPARRQDISRKLKQADTLTIRPGTLDDVRQAWHWMEAVWDERGEDFGETPYEVYLETNLSWLQAVEHTGRATLKIDIYRKGNLPVGVSCCVLHRYRRRGHCDDYLTWFDPKQAAGLGIASAVHNLTHTRLHGYRYNMGNPGVNNVHHRHQYKYDLLPPSIRLTQAIFYRGKG